MSSFACPSYLTVRSSLYIILIWDHYIFNLYSFCQTEFSYVPHKPHQCTLRFNEQITKTNVLLSQPSIRPVPAPVILLSRARATVFPSGGGTGGTPMSSMSPLITAVPPIKSKNCPPSIFVDHDKKFFRYFFNLCTTKANLTSITS